MAYAVDILPHSPSTNATLLLWRTCYVDDDDDVTTGNCYSRRGDRGDADVLTRFA